MSKLKNIFKQALKNEKLLLLGKLTTNNFYVNTNGMSYKDFKKAMKLNGWSADSKEARGFFYEQLNPEPEEIVQKVKNPYIVGLGETLLPIAPVTPTGVEKVIVKETSTKPMTNPVKTVVNPIKVTKKVSLPEQQVVEIKKVVVPANPKSLDPTYYDTNENLGISFDWNKMNEEFGGLSPEQVLDLLKYLQMLKNHSHKHYMFPASWGTYNTHYFLKGGSVKQSSSQQDAVMLFVKALAQTLQADPQLVIQEAQLNPEALKSAVQVYQESKGDIQKAAQAFSQVISSKKQVAKHGAKLNYLKSLKNKCAEDEELYYFKKGGSMGCGCKKKEQGGELKEEKKDSPIMKFKKENKISKHLFGKSLPTAPQVIDAYSGGIYVEDAGLPWINKILGIKNKTQIIGPRNILKYPRVLERIIYNNNDTAYNETPAYDPDVIITGPTTRSGKSSDKNKSEYNILKRRFTEGESLLGQPKKYEILKQLVVFKKGGELKEEKCGGKMKKKACGGIKFKLAKCGSKMKKHQNGGSLNGIPFIRKGNL